MKRLVLVSILTALLAAAPAQAKELLGAQLCGADGCVTQRDSMLAEGPGGPFSGSGSIATPAKPGGWYRGYLLAGDHGKVFGRLPFFYVPDGHLIVQPGEGAQPTTWSHPEGRLAALLAELAQRTKPLSTPTITEVAVNGTAVSDPQSYLRLYSIGGKPQTYPTDTSSVQVVFESDRPSPWTTGNYIVVYPKSNLLVRDGQLVSIPAGIAARVARGESLDVGDSFPWLLTLAGTVVVLLAGLLWRFRLRTAPQPVTQA
ncbi:MAG: hypothetical protein M3P41_13825 [Actinomycetota bacterium]|nr:hypothetical protein [Actinomycetota bacterium]